MPKFPEKPRTDHAPEGHVPNPRKRHGGEHNVGSSNAAPGHNDYGNRMSHPFRDGFAPNDETGEGQ